MITMCIRERNKKVSTELVEKYTVNRREFVESRGAQVGENEGTELGENRA